MYFLFDIILIGGVMKKKKLFKNKTQMVIYTFTFLLCIILFIIIGKTDFKKYEETESKIFSSLYNLVEDDNLYSFSNATEVLNILNGRSGIILLGFPLNEWTNYTADILNEVAKEMNVDKIYYYDFLKDRDESNGTYETIVNKLKLYVTIDDEGTKDLHAPTVLVVKNGEVIGYFDDTSTVKGTITPEVYYNEFQRGITYQMFKTALIEYMK